MVSFHFESVHFVTFVSWDVCFFDAENVLKYGGREGIEKLAHLEQKIRRVIEYQYTSPIRNKLHLIDDNILKLAQSKNPTRAETKTTDEIKAFCSEFRKQYSSVPLVVVPTTYSQIKESELKPYIYPSDEEIRKVGVTGIFLGHYLKWDARKQVEVIKKIGFTVADKPCEGTYTNYENLDTKYVSLHDYFKFLKYGFGRTTDHVSIDIRNNRLSREEGLNLVKQFEGKIPLKNLQEFLTEMEITKEEFYEICEKFTNKEIFKKDQHGNLLYDESHNLEKIIYDNS